jgi:hypothetical protein
VGAALITWVSLRVARENWLRWVILGIVGMMLFTVLALVAGEFAVVAIELVRPPHPLWNTPVELAALIVNDVLFLLPISVPIGFLFGFGFFGAAGWLWARRLASRATEG